MLNRSKAGMVLLCLLLLGNPVLSAAQASETGEGEIAQAASWQETEEEPSDSTSRATAEEAASSRHTSYVPRQEAVCLLTTDGYEKKLDNGILSLWYQEASESIRVVDNRTGYVWGCVEENEDLELNSKWTARANSLCYITYYDLEGKSVEAGLSESVWKAQYQWESDRVICQVSSKKLGISFSFQVALVENQLTFSMKDDSIQETGKSRLASVSFVNFFGCVYEDMVPGYLLVPDGSGALIRFQKAKAYGSGYNKKVYGYDLAIEQNQTLSNLNGNRTDDYATEEFSLSLPVWGVVHGENQNGFLAMIDSGEEYATISAIPAGAESENVRFTRAYATFTYRPSYPIRISSSRSVEVVPEERNPVNPSLTFLFVNGEDACYSGMAQICRERLLVQGKLPQERNESGSTSGVKAPEGEAQGIPLLLHVVGSEVKEGFLGNGQTVLTTAQQAEDMTQALYDSGITNLTLLLSGWMKGGYHGASYGTCEFEKQVGSRSQIEALGERVTEAGGRLVLTVNPMKANKDQIQYKRQAALNTMTDPVKETVPNQSLMYPDTYYLRHSQAEGFIREASDTLSEFELLFEGAGKYLYSDFTVNDEQNRSGVKEELKSALAACGQPVWLDGTNLFLLPLARAVINLPTCSSQYLYETDSVPFLQMVLRGSVDYYAPYANQGFYSQASILKMIEYGAFPSFLVIGADNFDLNDTPLENCFSLNFTDWEETICQVYGQVSEALAPVEGACMLSHRAVAEGVYEIVYDNGVTITVNYGETDFVKEKGAVVPKGGYLLEELS